MVVKKKYQDCEASKMVLLSALVAHHNQMFKLIWKNAFQATLPTKTQKPHPHSLGSALKHNIPSLPT